MAENFGGDRENRRDLRADSQQHTFSMKPPRQAFTVIHVKNSSHEMGFTPERAAEQASEIEAKPPDERLPVPAHVT